LAALASAGCPADTLPDGWLEVKDTRLVEQPDQVAATLAQAGCPPMQLIVDEEDLEHYFLRLVGMNGEVEHA
jgi:ABC-2 type transport system ATP-binding protein